MKTESIWAAFQSTCRPLRAGYRRHLDADGTSTSGVLWALYDRGAAEEEVGWVADSGNTEFAERLTGLHRVSASHAGSHFSVEPEIQVSRNYVLIKQFSGLDV